MEEDVLMDDVEVSENEQWSESVEKSESEDSFFSRIFKS
jgi:hypothetical protein